MDRSDEPSCNKDVEDSDQDMEHQSSSQSTPIESPTTDKIDYKNITDNQISLASNRHQNSSAHENTEIGEIVENIWNAFDAFQNTIIDVYKKDIAVQCSSYDFTSASESSTIGTTASSKLKNRPFSNLELGDRWIHHDIFREDDDWDIYQPGFNTTEFIPATESSLESNFILGKSKLKRYKRSSKNIFTSGTDYGASQRKSPKISSAKGSYQSSSSVNEDGAFRKYIEDWMLKEVESYFLENPIKVTMNLSDQERKKCIIRAPYFSKNFEIRHNLNLPIEDFYLPEGLKKEVIQEQETAGELYENYRRQLLRRKELREKLENVRSQLWFLNQTDGTSEGISDNLSAPTHADSTSCPETTNRAHIIQPPGLNTSNPNPCSADNEVKALPKTVEARDSLSDSSEEHLMQSNDILEDDPKKSPSLMQSSNEDEEEI